MINNAGESAGESFRVSTAGNILADDATLWSRNGAARNLGYLTGLNQSTALGLSRSGFVSGESASFNYASGTFRSEHAFVWPGHGPLLALPVPHLSYSRSLSMAHQISDNGTVAGSAGPARGQLHAYIWTCAFRQAFRPRRTAATAPGPARASARAAMTAASRWAALRRRSLH